MATDDSTPSPAPALSFGGVAASYERGRPGYPRAAAEWLTGAAAAGPLSVLELGAGTGKLTEHLVALGHDVHATDPDPAMLDLLAAKLPGVRISQTTAEEIPAADASYDVVIAAQCYHWFDKEKALPEIARVLRRSGHFSIVWNSRDERIPWVKRFGRLLGPLDHVTGPDDALYSSPFFGVVEPKSFKHWQVVDRESILDLAVSRSNIATLPAERREAKLREVKAFYDDYGRGMDGMQIPYVTDCFKAGLGIRPQRSGDAAVHEADGRGGPLATEGSVGEHPAGMPDPPTDDDSGMLLIDFR